MYNRLRLPDLVRSRLRSIACGDQYWWLFGHFAHVLGLDESFRSYKRITLSLRNGCMHRDRQQSTQNTYTWIANAPVTLFYEWAKYSKVSTVEARSYKSALWVPFTLLQVIIIGGESIDCRKLPRIYIHRSSKHLQRTWINEGIASRWPLQSI